MEGVHEAVNFTPYIVVVNSAVVGALLVGAGLILRRTKLTAGVPDRVQNVGEFVLDFFVGKARDMSHGHDRSTTVRRVAPFLAAFFLFIFVSNVFGVVPVPKLNMPPTAYFSVTLALAISSVLGTVVLSALFQGPPGAVKHLFWPNPLEFVSKITDVFSLSLRLFGNIGGEFMTVLLVIAVVPWGIPLILHALGFIPAFVQALVFTLLTASFVAGAIHKEEKEPRAKRGRRFALRRKKADSPDLVVEGGS